MGHGLNVENITNGLIAIQRIKQLYKQDENNNSSASEERENTIRPDRLSLLEDTLNSIYNFLPDERSSTFNIAFNEGKRYSGAYRDMKQHVRSVDWSNIKLDNIYDGFKIALPMLNTKQKLNLSKVIQVIDVIKS